MGCNNGGGCGGCGDCGTGQIRKYKYYEPYDPGLPVCPIPEDDGQGTCHVIEDMEQEVNPNKNCCTVCSGGPEDNKKNIWFQCRAPGFAGRCILDEMTYQQVYDVLLRSPSASRDLQRITKDPKLLSLAREVKLEMTDQEDAEQAAKLINANSLPYYTVMRGNTGGDIR